MNANKMGLKVGDRVAVYNDNQRKTSNIKSILGDGSILLEAGWCAHPKQCRRLVRKERRRIYIDADQLDQLNARPGNDGNLHVANYPARLGSRWAEFIEVKKK